MERCPLSPRPAKLHMSPQNCIKQAKTDQNGEEEKKLKGGGGGRARRRETREETEGGCGMDPEQTFTYGGLVCWERAAAEGSRIM